jgi:glycosyltransferase involved in cell wall biosynthesis
MPGVSVIIPTYNRGDLVTEAIESVLRQSYADLELIVVDDGSTDDTASVVGGIGDERIRYFSKDNGGQSSACNFAFRHAEGRYIAYLDSDDMWPEAYLETMVRQLDAKTDYGVAYARVIQRYPDGREEQLSKPERYRSGRITKYFFGFVPCLIPSAMCFRRSVWEGIWWDEALRRSHDFDVFLRPTR